MMMTKQILMIMLVPVLLLLAGCGSDQPVTGVSVQLAAAACIGCHSDNRSPGTGDFITDEWQSSTHSVKNATSCRDCHQPVSGHPNTCGSCHGGSTPITPEKIANGDVIHNPDTAQVCYGCHGVTATVHPLGAGKRHFDTYLFGSVSTARYVGPQNVNNCRSCHNPHRNTILPQHKDWAASGHGAVDVTPWTRRTSSTDGTNYVTPAAGAVRECVRCHTTTGYINYVTSNFTDIHSWGSASDKVKQTLYCNACHDDGRDPGRAYGYKRRRVPPVTGYYNYSSRYNNPPPTLLVSFPFPDIATSNICMSCHVGRESGATLKAITAAGGDYTLATKMPFVSSHYLTAGATIFRASGYEFAGRDYADPPQFAHRKIGMANYAGTGSDGPCVTCHMRPARHTFLPVTFSTLSSSRLNARIGAVVSPVCADCHASGWNVADLQQRKDAFKAALDALQAQLALRTYNFANGSFSPSPTTWLSEAAMGAAFNMNLLSHDYGAYAHNSHYSRRLIYDSIDYLDDLTLNDSVGVTLGAWSAPTPEKKALAMGWLLSPTGGRP
jgi:hypothetical protein